MREQIEAVHGQTQLREKRSRLRIGRAAFHPPLRAPKALGQRAVLIDVAQAAQKATDFLRRAPRLSHLAQSGRGQNRAGLRGLEYATLKRPALPRAIRINPTRAIRAQRRTRLTKKRHGRPTARDRHRQTERTQVLRIVARPKLDVVKKGTVAAQAASKAEVFTDVHAPPSRRRPPKCKPPVKKQPRPLVRELEPESPEFSPTPDLQKNPPKPPAKKQGEVSDPPSAPKPRALAHRYRTLDGRPFNYETVSLPAPALFELARNPGENTDVAAATTRSFNVSLLSPKNAAPISAVRSPAAPAPASANPVVRHRDFPSISVQACSSSFNLYPVHCLFHRPSALHFVHSSSLEPSGSFVAQKFDYAPLFIRPVPRPTARTSQPLRAKRSPRLRA